MPADRAKLAEYLQNAMTIDQLIERLQDVKNDFEKGGDTPVLFGYNYGDYWKTQVGERVSDVEINQVKWSEYHRMPAVEASDSGDEPDTCQEVALIC